uniref:ATP-binding protein n=1 Tax=Nonomuraea pusilla TaxID=46177 RepID=UPI0007C75BFF
MVRFGVLGPLAVWADGGEAVRVGEPKARLLLAALLARGGGPVPADRLVDDLWGARPLRNPSGTLQARVSELRRALGDPGLVVRTPAGYRLADARTDARDFLDLVGGRSSGPRERAARLGTALALWRGPAYADVADEEFAGPEITRLEEARLAALEERAELLLELGEPVDLIGLAGTVAAHPLRERLRALHMRALYRAGRQSEALASYGELRALLAGELGLDPSPELAALHRAILRHEPSLAPPLPLGAARPDPPVPPLLRGAARSNLPAPLTGLVGRDADLEEVRALLEASRLVTLTGPGGVGKTSLALEAARGVAAAAEPYPDGVWLVELAGADDPAGAVAAVLGVRDDGAGPLAPRLARALADRRALLVLDNCEHLVEAVAALVAALLRAAPPLRVLVTSQEPLGVTGERVRPVPPLSQADAVRLFTARAALPPGDHASGDVATVCRRLDGIPLALELAATRVRALGVRGVAQRLDDRFRLLNAGPRDAPARQRTLRAVIDWSWEPLTQEERVVLRRLSFHADGCTLEAAEEVCAEPGVDVLDVLARLVDRSLVVVAEGPRYRLLESVAAYCAERLREAGEHDLVRERHARHYTALAERARLRGPARREWLAALDAEHANLRLALTGPRPVRLANALAWYWFLRGRLREARASLTAALAAADAAGAGDTAEAATASVWRAGFALLMGEPPHAAPVEVRRAALDPAGRALADWFLTHARWAYGDMKAHHEAAGRALAAYEELGDRWGAAAALSLRAKLAVGHADVAAMERDGRRALEAFRELGDAWGQIEAMDALDRAAEIRGDHREAARLREEGLRLAEELGFEVAFKLGGLGRVALLAGDYDRADAYHERARRLAVAQSYKAAEESALLGLAMSARRQGRYEEAEEHLRPVLGWLREVGGTPGIAFAMAELGFAAEQRGDAATALARHREGHAAALATGDPRAVALSLEGLAGALSLAEERAEEAARLLGRAAAVRESVGTPLPQAERFDVDRVAARLRALLGDAAYERARASGEREPGRCLPGASAERELGQDLPGALGRGPGVEAAAQSLHPLGHAHEAEAAAQPRHLRI